MTNHTHQSDRVDLAVVVLNYKTPGLVVDCLASLDGQVDAQSQHVIVVDNCSGDDSVEQIESAIESHGWSSWAKVVASPINGGFAAGNNVGVKACDAKRYLLVNSDTIVRPGAIAEMMGAMDREPEVAMLGPRLEWPDGEYQVSTFRYRTPISEMIYAMRLGLVEKIFPRHVVARPMDSFTVGIDWVSFACVMIRAEVFEAVGLLDEGYFMYFEDMGFCRKATKGGFAIGYQPEAHVVHLRGGSSPVKEQTQNKKRRPAYFYAARSHYLRSSFGFGGYVMGNVLWTIGWLLGSLRGKTGAVEHEWRDIWTSARHTMHTGGSA